MSSLLSFLGINMHAFDLYNKILSDPEVVKLINNNSASDDTAHIIIRNFLLKQLDWIYTDIIDKNKELDNIFSNDKLDKETQIKLCAGTIAKHICTNIKEDEDIRFIKFDKEEFIKFFCSLPTMLDLEIEQINSVSDLYSATVDTMAHFISLLTRQVINRTTEHDSDNFDDNQKRIISICKFLNNTFEYKTNYYNTKYYNHKKRKAPSQDEERDPKRPKH
jgi:hypothetical protein